MSSLELFYFLIVPSAGVFKNSSLKNKLGGYFPSFHYICTDKLPILPLLHSHLADCENTLVTQFTPLKGKIKQEKKNLAKQTPWFWDHQIFPNKLYEFVSQLPERNLRNLWGNKARERDFCSCWVCSIHQRAQSWSLLTVHEMLPGSPRKQVTSPAGFLSALCSCNIFQEGIQRNYNLQSSWHRFQFSLRLPSVRPWLSYVLICFFFKLETTVFGMTASSKWHWEGTL